MNKIITILLFIFASTTAFAQCSIEPWSLDKRISKSTVVLEGKIIKQEGTWGKNQKNIYTINTVEVFKVFKGKVSSETIKLVTEGGIVGSEMLNVSPSLELQKDEIGMFLLKENTILFDGQKNMLRPTASVQSFIKYDLLAMEAYDMSATYANIKYELYGVIKKITGENPINIKYFDTEANRKKIMALSPPTITSVSATAITAGTSSVLTINGSNFGSTRGAGKVGFKDANDGGTSYYYSPTSWSYTLWSDTKIKVVVPRRAGTGKIQVVNNANETVESSSALTIDWSHLNILYPLNATDTIFYELRHIDDNGSGGYDWQMSHNFASKSNAVTSFIRSLEEWRCETQMNWSLGADTDSTDVESDDVNIVCFTEFGDSRLGVCYSRYSGCFIGGGTDMRWHVRETDIEFDSTYSWYYGTGTPSSNEFDFETVSTHELGHGHQLGHVINSSKVMHYSVSKGQRKADLVSTDITAGNYVKNRSTTISACSKGLMTVIPTGSCTIQPPTSGFAISNTSICPTVTTTVTDETGGSVQAYAWDFGVDASPATSTTQGPHTVSYSSSGSKSIRLITTNAFGSDTLTKSLTVKALVVDTPFFVTNDTVCKIREAHAINALNAADDYIWSISSGGSLQFKSANTIRVTWNDTGSQSITVHATNSCGDGPTTTEPIYVNPKPTSTFSKIIDGISISFTNESTYGDSYLWDFGDGTTSTETNPSHKFPDKGDYTVSLTTTNICGVETFTQNDTLSYNVGINDISNQNIRIYPNPLSNGQTLTIKGGQFDHFKLYNLEGKLITEGEITNNKIQIEVEVTALYMLSITSANQTVNYRINITK